MASKLGRPRRYSEYERLLQELPKEGVRRPKYVNAIGISSGLRGATAWVKIRISKDSSYRGRHYARGGAAEIRLGKLSSWNWEQLEKRRDEFQGRADRGEPLETIVPPRFEEWAKQWLEGTSNRLRSHSIIRIHVNKHLLPVFGGKNLDQISSLDVNRWISKRLCSAAPATVKRELSTLSAILGTAVRSEFITKNPCADANIINGIVPRQRFLDGVEMVRLLAEAHHVDEAFPDLILWFIHSGMRKAEVLDLRKSDIRKIAGERRYVQVRRSKSDQSRLIACTQTMVDIIERQTTRFPTHMKLFPITRMTLRRKWERIRGLSNLSDVTLHDLRRTHATHAAAGGVDLRTLADRIGHGSLAMLQRHYAAVMGTASSEAAEKVQRAFDHLSPPNT